MRVARRTIESIGAREEDLLLLTLKSLEDTVDARNPRKYEEDIDRTKAAKDVK